MSFILNGTTYYQPTDKDIVAYDGGKYLLIATGNTIQRVKMSEVAQSAHVHIYDTLTLSDSYVTRIQSGSASNQLLLGVSGRPYIHLPQLGSTSLQARLMTHNALNAITWQAQEAGTYPYCAFGNVSASASWPWQWPNEATQGRLRAYSYNTYACDRRTKRSIKPIEPKTKLDKLHGIEYIDTAGTPKVGIAAQDLEAAAVPETVFKNKDGDYEAINLLPLIPVLLEEVKALRKELDVVKGKVK